MDQYKILGSLGDGSFGTVLKARNNSGVIVLELP